MSHRDRPQPRKHTFWEAPSHLSPPSALPGPESTLHTFPQMAHAPPSNAHGSFPAACSPPSSPAGVHLSFHRRVGQRIAVCCHACPRHPRSPGSAQEEGPQGAVSTSLALRTEQPRKTSIGNPTPTHSLHARLTPLPFPPPQQRVSHFPPHANQSASLCVVSQFINRPVSNCPP